MSKPFSTKEIKTILKDLPTDRAPRPDGFNGLFVNKCCPIIEKDFLNLIQDFLWEIIAGEY